MILSAFRPFGNVSSAFRPHSVRVLSAGAGGEIRERFEAFSNRDLGSLADRSTTTTCSADRASRRPAPERPRPVLRPGHLGISPGSSRQRDSHLLDSIISRFPPPQPRPADGLRYSLGSRTRCLNLMYQPTLPLHTLLHQDAHRPAVPAGSVDLPAERAVGLGDFDHPPMTWPNEHRAE